MWQHMTSVDHFFGSGYPYVIQKNKIMFGYLILYS